MASNFLQDVQCGRNLSEKVKGHKLWILDSCKPSNGDRQSWYLCRARDERNLNRPTLLEIIVERERNQREREAIKDNKGKEKKNKENGGEEDMRRGKKGGASLIQIA